MGSSHISQTSHDLHAERLELAIVRVRPLLEPDTLLFFQRVDRVGAVRNMEEDIDAADVRPDESESFVLSKEFYFSGWHFRSSKLVGGPFARRSNSRLPGLFDRDTVRLVALAGHDRNPARNL
jgi:hypothetical protein